MSTIDGAPAWTKLHPIDAHHGGCLNCGPLDRLELKRILLLDIATGGQDEADDAIAKFDADFTLAAAEIEGALEALVGELGGLARKDAPDLVDQAHAAIDNVMAAGTVTFTGIDGEALGIGNDLDPLYHDARRVVIEQGRPSISPSSSATCALATTAPLASSSRWRPMASSLR